MKITKVDIIPVRARYHGREQSAVVDIAGVCNVLVRLASDDGLVGWGEAAAAASTESIVAALAAMKPFLDGRSPWDREAIADDILIAGRWRYQAMTAAFALAAIDMALWDLCGQACGEPLYRLLGGAARDAVEYFFYLQWARDDGLAAQCRQGAAAGYRIFYLKVGEDAATDERRLAIVRDAAGPGARLRIDANQSWTPDEARRLITRWHRQFDLDMVEGPVLHHPPDVMRRLKDSVPVPLCADEGLRGEEQAFAMIAAGAADLLCLGPYDVGSLRRVQSLAWYAGQLGQRICKHTWGELGIYAAAMQHLMLALPNAADGHQQTAQFLAEDVLADTIPIATGPRWGRIDGPGLGVKVDEDKVAALNEAYRRDGEFPRVRSRQPRT